MTHIFANEYINLRISNKYMSSEPYSHIPTFKNFLIFYILIYAAVITWRSPLEYLVILFLCGQAGSPQYRKGGQHKFSIPGWFVSSRRPKTMTFLP